MRAINHSKRHVLLIRLLRPLQELEFYELKKSNVKYVVFFVLELSYRFKKPRLALNPFGIQLYLISTLMKSQKYTKWSN